jgi:mediator of RNA polymerase II transcription subunit 25
MAAKKAIYSILDLKGNVIQNVGTPSLDTDVATKASAGAQASAAQAAAIDAAATDATTKANAAVTTANTYTDDKITTLLGGADTAYDTLKELQTALENQDDAVAALVLQIGTVETNLATETQNRTSADTALDGRLDTAEGDIDTLQTDVGTLQTDVGTLQSDVGTLQTDVGTLQTDVGTLQTDVGTLQTDVGTIQTDISTLQGDVSTINTSLADKLQIATGTANGSGTSTAEGFEYTITHNLNKANVIVQVYDGNDVVDVVIRKVNNNSLKLITGAALGETTLTVVVAG